MMNEGVELQNQNQENQNHVQGAIGEEENIVQQPAIGNGAGAGNGDALSDEELEKNIQSLDGRSQVLVKNKNDQQNIYFIILGALITAVTQILSSPSPKCKLVSYFFIPLFALAFFLMGFPLIQTAGKHAVVKIEYDWAILERERRRSQQNNGDQQQRDRYREGWHKLRMVTAAFILVIFNLLVIGFIVMFCEYGNHASAGVGCTNVCNKICTAD